MPDYYLGLMSGTSVDGIDAVLVDLSGNAPILVHAHTYAWSQDLQQRILDTLSNHTTVPLLTLGELNSAIGDRFGEVALAAIQAANLDNSQITAIGSHGQTLFHAPEGQHAFSLQAGDPNRIAEITGITTVADFRNRDIAAGGQGAPLVPAFHQALFHDPKRSRAVLNIGGIANLTLLPQDQDAVTGFDTGPGNLLMDAWHNKHHGLRYDRDGAWAGSGKPHSDLLQRLMGHPYFARRPPKSTGRELFNLDWLEALLPNAGPDLPAEDVQRTLLEFTVTSVADALQRFAGSIDQLLVCGGGAHNRLLIRRLSETLAQVQVTTTESCGLHPDWVEATAFAWLAKQTLEGKPGNLPAVTGARRRVVLGAVYRGGAAN